MSRLVLIVSFALLMVTVAVRAQQPSQPSQPPQPAPSAAQTETLRPVEAFQTISDPRARSIALFTEAGKVIQSPRCLNCHPVERAPTQGDDRHPHNPPMKGGEDGHGVAGLPCAACHGPRNFTTAQPASTIQSIPGNPKWALAPKSMAWQDQPLATICAQLKDSTRNGGRTLTQIQDHMAHDELVAWGWNPGPGRVPAPGTQESFGALIQAWIATGAHCPAS